MGFLSGLALVLLTLFGYSSGRMLFAANRKVNLGAFDILLTTFLGIVALWARSYLGRWITIPVFIVIGLLAGVLTTIILMSTYPLERKTTSEPSESDALFGKIRKSLKSFFTRTGNFQSRILLSWFYFIILMPFGILVRLTSDPLAIQKGKRESYWKLGSDKPDSLESARRQF
jgi:hypothetical protein